MPVNQFAHFVHLAETQLREGRRPPDHRVRPRDFADEVRNILTAARAETMLEEARSNLAYALPVESIELWMRPEFFQTPYSSVAAALLNHAVIPTGVENKHLHRFLEGLRIDAPWRVSESHHEINSRDS